MLTGDCARYLGKTVKENEFVVTLELSKEIPLFRLEEISGPKLAETGRCIADALGNKVSLTRITVGKNL